MSVWKKKEIGGVERIFKDGRVIMDASELELIPAAVKRMDVGDSIEFEDQAPLPPEQPVDNIEPDVILPSAQKAIEPVKAQDKISIISGEPATRRRFLNGEEYWLTEEEYQTYNLGKLAQAIREKH